MQFCWGIKYHRQECKLQSFKTQISTNFFNTFKMSTVKHFFVADILPEVFVNFSLLLF